MAPETFHYYPKQMFHWEGPRNYVTCPICSATMKPPTSCTLLANGLITRMTCLKGHQITVRTVLDHNNIGAEITSQVDQAVDWWQFRDAYSCSIEWQERAAACKAIGHCETCRAEGPGVVLNAHHNTYDRYGHEQPGDLICLCQPCHELFTQDKRRRRATSFRSGSRPTARRPAAGTPR